ncbi:hypothetical protein BBW65_00585 [Helicobacter enhydrae]|uniref:RCK C-terminal domain-containing protein n=1 Tax=Helicobacter enhydrae TaxID=222136 RepID=A0A1B1U3R4_9HELI|nr:TrkA C-terminal domain-containing protein [Helicobacter enhydrae]ANV97403.1 hypothetical protein BBW65_00585 [Helicobacter enhydrae]
MNSVILVLLGESARLFLSKLIEKYYSANIYHTICPANLIPDTHPNSFVFHSFDPTSLYKITKNLPAEANQIFILHDNDEELEAIIQNLKTLYPQTPMICNASIELQHFDNLLQISTHEILSDHLASLLINTPQTPQNFGLGQGEIIEILVPPGSLYCYRSISSISQKDWKIVGIYRGNEFLLSRFSTTIQPNDRLLAVGDWRILNHIYKQITNSLGQFPIPFGKDLFLYLDESLCDENEILKDIEDALFLHRKLNNQTLYIALLNPRTFSLIEHLKKLDDPTIQVFIHYNTQQFPQVIQADTQKKIGLAILNPKLFNFNKKLLFDLAIPIFKIGSYPLEQCTQSVVLLEEQSHNIASAVLDISSQLSLDLHLFDFDCDEKYHTQEKEEFDTLSKVFNKKINYTRSSLKNPILLLKEEFQSCLQFLPFSPNVKQNARFAFVNTDLSLHSSLSHIQPQIILPSSYEND